MIFRDRTDAGRRLASMLRKYASREDVIVLGIPRGGVVVAYEVAVALGVELDIYLSRKLGVPGQEELAFGAVSTGGVRVLEQATIDALGISPSEIERATSQARAELERRELLYRGARPGLILERRSAILVDDGIATGSSMHAAIQALRQLKPARIVVAVPVAPVAACNELKAAAEEVVCVTMPESFFAIGQFYEDFFQVEDDEVRELLGKAHEHAPKKGEYPHQNIETNAH